jgi:hypothetical protein
MVELLAHNIALPQNQTMESFAQGATTAENVRNSEFERAKQGMEQIAAAAYGVLGNDLNGQADPGQWEQTLDYFEAKGLPVKMLRGKPQLANTLARSSINVLSAAQTQEQLEQGWKRLEQDMLQAANGTQETFYGTPVPFQNDKGDISFGQVGNAGTFKPLDLPEGASPAPTTRQVDTGTEIITLDIYGNELFRTPKQNEQAAFETAFGGAAGKAAAERIDQLPGLIAKTDNMVATIDGILNDPALDSSTGWLAWMQAVPGTDQYRFGQRALQLQGQAFLQAFESLRGGGQITVIEGEKATQAIGRLSTAQKPEDYRQALEELKAIINAAKERATTRATVTPDNRNGATPDAEGDVLEWTDVF